MKRILTTLALAVLVLALPASIGAYLLSGNRLAVVETPSMGTYAPVGTLVLTHPVGTERIRVGQAIMFLPPGSKESYFHRVHAITPQGFITKGDLNSNVDPWRITSQQVIGIETLHVVNLGWLIKALPVFAGGGLVLLVYLRFFVERYWRLPGAVSGGTGVVALANYLFHPLVGSVLIDKRVVNREAIVTFVNTGILPLDVNALGGTRGIAQQGVVFTASTRKLSANGNYFIASIPHLEWWVGALLGALLLAPTLFLVGYTIRQRVTGRDWYEWSAQAPELEAGPSAEPDSAPATSTPAARVWASEAEREAWYAATITEYCGSQVAKQITYR